jgi:basic amino acid/polyamine antiporter, APA family
VTPQVAQRHGRTGTLDRLDPVVAGLGAMLGAGVFAGLSPVAGLSGRWLLLAVVIGALPALCAACSSADAAPCYPGEGTGHRSTRDLLGRWPARLAGGPFLLGRMAGAAAIALCAGAYLYPADPVAAALVLLVVVAVADAAGLRVPAVTTRLLLAVVLVVLAVVVAACFALPAPPPTGVPVPPGTPGLDQLSGLLPAAGMAFFGYLGFERLTAPGPDGVRLSVRARRRAVPLLFGAAVLGYLAVGAAALHQLGPVRLALSPAPLRDALTTAEGGSLAPVLAVGVLVATACTLFGLLGEARRGVATMAGTGDLPRGLTRPALAALPVALGGIAGVLLLSGTTALGLAAAGMLAYHACANAAARLLPRESRAFPYRTSCFGLGLCVLLLICLPPLYLAAAVVAVGLGGLLALPVSVRRVRPRR